APPQDHFPLAFVVARRMSGRALDPGNLGAHGLALRDQRDQLAIDVSQAPAQIVQRHVVACHESLKPLAMAAPFLSASRQRRKCFSPQKALTCLDDATY